MTNPDLTAIKLPMLAAFLMSVIGCSPPDNQYVAPPPPEVTVTTPIAAQVTRFIEENGDTEAVERAEVRSRVRGFVEAIHFEPGQPVNRETLLYQIEDSEYVAAKNARVAEVAAAEAAIAVAKARVITAEAEVNRANRDFQRQTTLLNQQATSQSEYDISLAANDAAKAMLTAAQSSVESAEAMLKQAKAGLEKAELDLGYTKVTAPIAGRVTKTDIKLGNLVENGTELSSVIDDSRVYVNFSISDRQLLELRRARMERSEGPVTQEQWSTLPVFARLETDEGFPFEGRLNYIDQEGVSAATGSLALRAVFDNPHGKLLPGLFVRVRMPVSNPTQSLLIPARAVLRDRVGSFLMVVGKDNRVERRDVTLGEQSAGWAVIETGITSEAVVVIEGLQRARPGAVVNPLPMTMSANDLPAAFRQRASSNDADTITPSTADEPESR